MRKTTFGKTGLSVTPLGFGGAEVGFLHTEQERVAKILHLLLDVHVNLVDTAATYQGSEESIGNALALRRSEYVLVSKCGVEFPGNEGENWSAKLIAQTIDRSLKLLKTPQIDVMLLHSCDLATLKKGEAIGALTKAKEAGKIRFCGYSGDNEPAAYAASLPEIAVVETSINVCDQANIEAVLPVAKKHNVGVIAKRPVANAPWRDDHTGIYARYVKLYQERFAKMGLDPASLGFSGPPAKAWPEIALRFTLSFEGVNTAIVGTTNPDNLRSNIAIVEKGPLPVETVKKIREAFTRAEKASDQKWTGQT